MLADLEIKKQRGAWRVVGTIAGKKIDRGFWLKADAIAYAAKVVQDNGTLRENKNL